MHELNWNFSSDPLPTMTSEIENSSNNPITRPRDNGEQHVRPANADAYAEPKLERQQLIKLTSQSKSGRISTQLFKVQTVTIIHIQAQVEELSPNHLQAQVEEELAPTHLQARLEEELSSAHLQAQVEEELSPTHLQAQVEEELSPTHFNTYLSPPLKTHFKLQKLYTTTAYIKLQKFATSTSFHIKLKKFDTNMLHIKLKKFNTTNNHIKLKKFDTTTPHIKQKKFNTTTPLMLMMLILLLEEQQLRVFLLFHILPRARRFFLPQLLPYKCPLFGQGTTKSLMTKVI